MPQSDLCYTNSRNRPELTGHVGSLEALRRTCSWQRDESANVSHHLIATMHPDLLVHYDQRGKRWYRWHEAFGAAGWEEPLPANTAFSTNFVDTALLQYETCLTPFTLSFGVSAGTMYSQRIGPFWTTGGGVALYDWTSVSWRFALPDGPHQSIFGWRLGPVNKEGTVLPSPPYHVHHFQLFDGPTLLRKMVQVQSHLVLGAPWVTTSAVMVVVSGGEGGGCCMLVLDAAGAGAGASAIVLVLVLVLVLTCAAGEAA